MTAGPQTPDISQPPAIEHELQHAVIIIPVFRHSVFAGDAIHSALLQKHVKKISIVIVDDGCPHKETQLVLQSFALTWSDRIHALRRNNGGLSAARNCGIEYALNRWPDVGAFYLQDADNEIEPDTISRAWQRLCQDSSAGWAYPDIAMKGSSFDYWDYSGPYSVLRHLVCNVSEAGSLISRAVFDAGCRFDENMKTGFEDWEFWWQAISKGFRGVHVPFMGLRYRKRPESMLSEAEERRQSIVRYMRDKHASLLSPRKVLEIELRECARYALIGDTVEIAGDVRDARQQGLTPSEFASRLASAVSLPLLYRQPGFLIFGPPEVFHGVRNLRLDRSVAFWLEQKLRTDGSEFFAALKLIVSPDGQIGWRERRIDGVSLKMEKFHAVTLTAQHAARLAVPVFAEIPGDPIEGALGGYGQMLSGHVLELSVPASILVQTGEAAGCDILANFTNILRSAFERQPVLQLNPKPNSNPDFLSLHHDVYRRLDMAAPAPLAANARTAVFALPIVSFGGVETTALRMAQAFKKAGWRCRLLVMAQTAFTSDEWLDRFEDIFFFWDDNMYRWDGPGAFLGSSFPQWTGNGADALEGIVSAADVVMNFHCAALHKMNANLRRKGVAIVASLHVVDQTAHGRLTGHPHIAIGHEHVIDYFACCSQQMSDFCHGLGVPADKIITVQNAPGRALDMEQAQISRDHKMKRGADQPLRILFLGRLDRQKGLPRLNQIMDLLKDKELNVQWRIAGSAVMGDESANFSSTIEACLEPPARSNGEVAALYDWADILILPSLWEGLPLTLLECAPFGDGAIAADTGAVREAVDDGENGFLITGEDDVEFAKLVANRIELLTHDRDMLHRMSMAAGLRPVRSWDESCKDLLAALDVRAGQKQKAFLDLA